MVEELCEYFTNIGEQLADNIDNVEEKEEGEYSIGKKLFLLPTCIDEVKGIVTELKSGGAPDENGLNIALIKNISEEIAEPISFLAINALKLPSSLTSSR